MSVASEGSCCVLCIWEMMLYPLSLQELAFAAPALPRKRWQPPQGHPCRPHHLFRPHLRAPSAGALRHFLHAFAAPDSPRKQGGRHKAMPLLSPTPPSPPSACACRHHWSPALATAAGLEQKKIGVEGEKWRGGLGSTGWK
jgi:hypothetical protein